MHRLTLVAASVTILLVLSASGQDKPANSDIDNIGRRNVSQGATNLYSIDKEIALGRQLSAVYEKQLRLSNDPELGEYINRLGQNIALNSDVRNLPVTFRVVESDEPGGMAFPGGFVFINSGTMSALDNEAELAFALAQGVAHIAARHGARQASQSQIVNRSAFRSFTPVVVGLPYHQRLRNFPATTCSKRTSLGFNTFMRQATIRMLL
jgi:predicted Zn-dependent protease